MLKYILKSSLFFKIILLINVFANTSFSQNSNPVMFDHLNILMYHRFGEDKFPSTNSTMDQFTSHIKELRNPKYNIIKLNDGIRGIKNKNLKDRSVSITVDDAYLSVYNKAWPILKKFNIPFTLFVSTDVIDKKISNYMNWDQIRELMDHGVIIGSQTKSHPHLHRLNHKQILYEIEYSNKRFIEELGFKPSLFAYPYGEYDVKTLEIIKGSGFEAAFGQHSGVAHISSGLFELPRFAMNENYGDLNRLKLVINALPIVVNDISPENTFLIENPPNFGFTIDPIVQPNKTVRCFASNNISSNTTRIGKYRIEVRLNEKFPKSRGRINCTMEATNNRWRWFGKQFVIN